MPNVQADGDIGEGPPDCVLDMTTIVGYCDFWVGNAKDFEPTLESYKEFFYFVVALSMTETL